MLLSERLSANDLLIDLAWNIDCEEIVQWCHDHNVLYVNTSVELWDPYAGSGHKHPTERTLYWRHMNLRRRVASWKERGPTAVIEHGANPGLISHFTKQALLDIASRAVGSKNTGAATGDISNHARTVRSIISPPTRREGIHCGERDTQIPIGRRKPTNSSIPGRRRIPGGTTTAEMGWDA
jgi:homospermidine synthase